MTHAPATAGAPPAADPRAPLPLLRVENLRVSFHGRPAVAGVSLSVFPAQTLAIVGESGCGKSVTALSILRLLPMPPASIEHGRVLLDRGGSEVDLLGLPPGAIRRVRGGDIAMIFQEPMSSLNPVFTIGEQIVEAVRAHQGISRRRARDAAVRSLEEVGVADAARRIDAYPHEFSGGMRQRAMIAMALACRSRLLIADEPTTAVDVTVQAQILALLSRLRRDRSLAVVLITHSLALVEQIADVVCVMYAGRVVEYAPLDAVLAHPLHPYTRALEACAPRLGERRDRLGSVRGALDPGALATVHGRRPWWPDTTGEHPGYQLAEVEPDHWLGVVSETESVPVPSIASRRRDPVRSGDDVTVRIESH